MAVATEQTSSEVVQQLASTVSVSDESREPSPVSSAENTTTAEPSATAVVASSPQAKKESAKARRREDKAIGNYPP